MRMRYRRKDDGPEEVDFFEITDEWFSGPHPNPLHVIGVIVEPSESRVVIERHNGESWGFVGDWIGVKDDGSVFIAWNKFFNDYWEPVPPQLDQKKVGRVIGSRCSKRVELGVFERGRADDYDLNCECGDGIVVGVDDVTTCSCGREYFSTFEIWELGERKR